MSDDFADQQFQIQVELEDLDRDELRAAGQRLAVACDHLAVPLQRRIEYGICVLLALRQIPGIDPVEAEDRFAAWCDGFGVAAQTIYDDLKTRKNGDA